MTWKAQQAKMQETEAEILRLLGKDYSAEDLFRLRVDTGMGYLLERYPYQKAKSYWLDPKFWRWFRQCWHINDQEIIKTLRKWGFDEAEYSKYAETQEAKMEKFNMVRALRTV